MYLLKSEFFRPIDRKLAEFIGKKYNASSIVIFSVALCSRALADGHSCIDISKVKPEDIWDDSEITDSLPQFPLFDEWHKALTTSNSVGEQTAQAPLTLISNRLYLTRYFKYEQEISHRFDSAVAENFQPQLSDQTTKLIQELFADREDQHEFGGDLQLAGALLPFFYRYAILSGGPGTGKTTTVAKMLAMALSHGPSITIALTAPTGKAAQRMNESLQGSLQFMNLPESIHSTLSSVEAKTIHRLLGSIHNSPTFKHNEKKPLPFDLVVVDEASMIDLPLMAKLLTALKPTTRLILLGDQYQLASVEAGSVLGDLCTRYGINQFNSVFADLYNSFASSENQIVGSGQLSPVIQLTRSFRFNPHGGVGKISAVINEGDSSIIDSLSNTGEVQLIDDITISELAQIYKPLLASSTPEEALKRIGDVVILTATNKGKFGQTEINEQIKDHFSARSQRYVNNMPILVTSNAYKLNLFNGDIGVLSEKNGNWYGVFSDGNNKVHEVPLVLLPQWQPAFAITIHKSQGSEYQRVFILLGDRENRLLTRELIYTAITRVKPAKGDEEGSVKLFGSKGVTKEGIKQKIVRSSGLALCN